MAQRNAYIRLRISQDRYRTKLEWNKTKSAFVGRRFPSSVNSDKNKVTRNQGQQAVHDVGQLNCEKKKYRFAKKWRCWYSGGGVDSKTMHTHALSKIYPANNASTRRQKKEQRSRVKWCGTQVFLLLIRCRHDSACVALSRKVLAHALCGR